MNTDREQRIRDRAYQIWEDQGRPEGGHEQHWLQAEREIDQEGHGNRTFSTAGEAAETSAETAKPKRRSTRSAKGAAAQPESGSTPAETAATEREVEPSRSKRGSSPR